jgi:hypothetical protein
MHAAVMLRLYVLMRVRRAARVGEGKQRRRSQRCAHQARPRLRRTASRQAGGGDGEGHAPLTLSTQRASEFGHCTSLRVQIARQPPTRPGQGRCQAQGAVSLHGTKRRTHAASRSRPELRSRLEGNVDRECILPARPAKHLRWGASGTAPERDGAEISPSRSRGQLLLGAPQRRVRRRVEPTLRRRARCAKSRRRRRDCHRLADPLQRPSRRSSFAVEQRSAAASKSLARFRASVGGKRGAPLAGGWGGVKLRASRPRAPLPGLS